MSQASAIAAGDVIRTVWPKAGDRPLALYQGSGRSGATWNSWGLMGPLFESDAELGPHEANTWMHADHWHRSHYGIDGWLYLGRLGWHGQRPAPPSDYEQRLTLADGRLTTRVSGPSGKYTLSSFFDPGQPDILAVEIEYDFPDGFPALLFAPALEQNRSYLGKLQGTVHPLAHQEAPAFTMIEIEIGLARTAVGLRIEDIEGESRVVSDARGWKIEFGRKRGHHLLWLGASATARREELSRVLREASPKTWATRARENWQARWGQAWIHLPDPRWQALWARSHFQILASYGPEVRCPAAPAGWTGNAWPYPFPQDLSYIHPALLRLGHLDIAHSWVEFFARTLPWMEETTKRIYGAAGVMWAWEYPIGEASHLFPDGAPNRFQFEIHNAAYPARMAYETSLHLRDPAWTRETAWPVIRASARFYASTLRRANDGIWDLRVEPSMGQDELDAGSGGNYLCSLFSARYCLETAIRVAIGLNIADGEILQWRRILADGLAFSRLLGPGDTLYVTREGVTLAECLGRQKHPVQINPLIFLPLLPAEEPTREAYRRRRELCIGGKTGSYQGWTLPAYMLAACHSQDGEGMKAELDEAVAVRNIDADFLQVYESAPALVPYYFTSGGLYLQAVQDAIISDYGGEITLGAAIPDSWPNLTFGGLRSSDGRTWSGRREAGRLEMSSK